MIGYRIPERETYCILPLNQLSHAYFLAKGKKYNILSLFLQIHKVESTIHHLINRWSPFLSRKELCWATFPYSWLWHSYVFLKELRTLACFSLLKSIVYHIWIWPSSKELRFASFAFLSFGGI